MQAKLQEQLTSADAKVILETLTKLNNFSLQYAATLFPEDEETIK